MLGEFILKIFDGYNLLVIFAIIGFTKYLKNKIKPDYFIFVCIFVFCTYFQMFVANRFNAYMVYYISIIIYAFSAYGIYKIIEMFKNYKIRKISIRILMALYLIFNVSNFVHLPWVHP